MSTIRSEEKEGGVIVAFFNDAKILDEQKIQQIGNDLIASTELAKAGRMVLNFSGVSFMSSHMIGKLVLLNKKCKAANVTLKFCTIAPSIMEVFKIMKLNKVFDIYADEEKALKSFDKKGWFG